ncbi:hypothetical protein H6P81_002710 [Aristolochia fimbriata]|uniref:Uncharacterized protein n=1 Tax=Aristolochia fimbriata TaxID=158543 RepID=A0AAV7FDQ9_ARIFI|nr:hypothetical protein H6P81_002710 [Aristolochia fimbriata]
MGDSRLFSQKLVDPGEHPPILKWGNRKFRRKGVYMNEMVSGPVHEVGQSSSKKATATNEMNKEQSKPEYEAEPNEEHHRSDRQPDEEQPDPKPEVATTQRRQVWPSRMVSDPFVRLKTYQRRNKNT